MTYDIEFVKHIIETFIEESVENSKNIQDNKDVLKVNKAIYSLENFLFQSRKNKGINGRIDITIQSPNITASMEQKFVDKPYSPDDYQYYLLHHLAMEYDSKVSLYGLIDSFIEKYKSNFTLADIIITKTGATRCKTNIRFALNSLRFWGLVLNYDDDMKRSWSPSLFGLVILLNIRLCAPPVEREEIARTPAHLNMPNAFRGLMNWKNSIDPLLLASMKQFRDPSHIYVYLSSQSNDALNENEKRVLENIIREFVDFTHEGLEITWEGVKITKQFEVLSKKFQQNLFSTQQSNPKLLDKMFVHYRKIYET